MVDPDQALRILTELSEEELEAMAAEKPEEYRALCEAADAHPMTKLLRRVLRVDREKNSL